MSGSEMMDDARLPWLDQASPEFLADPYPTYHRLRREAPVYLRPEGDWYLTRFADVERMLTDPRFRREPPAGRSVLAQQQHEGAAPDEIIRHWMLFMDPPAHTRLRDRFGGAFASKRIKNLRPRIEVIVNDLLAPLWDGGSMEVIADLAYPLPVIVISELLGVPAEDRALLTNASRQLTKALDTGTNVDMTAAAPAALELMDYFRDLVQDRRRRPRDDVISSLVAGDARDGMLSDEVVLSNCVFLLYAGHETTKNLIGSSLLTLLRYPEQCVTLRRNPGMIEFAVEEFLRFESPLQKTCRWTAEEIQLGDTSIPRGELVVAIIGAANRDPDRFADPDQPKIDRRDSGHLAFGRGIHNCVGKLLARIEVQSAIGALLDRTRRMDLECNEVEWQDTTAIRGLKALPVSFEKA